MRNKCNVFNVYEGGLVTISLIPESVVCLVAVAKRLKKSGDTCEGKKAGGRDDWGQKILALADLQNIILSPRN